MSNATVSVLLPTGAKVSMSNFTKKDGSISKGVGLLKNYVDGSGSYLPKGGVDVVPPCKTVPSTVQVFGEDIEVTQRVGYYRDVQKTNRKGENYITPEWVDDPNGVPEVNQEDAPVFRGYKVLVHQDRSYEFKLRITDLGDLWNMSATLFPKGAPKLSAEQKKAQRKARAMVLS